MPDRNQVMIELSSRQGEDETVQSMKGEAVVRGGTVYIRYMEPETGPDGGSTRTMIKISAGKLKIMRHGAVESEQTFQYGRRLPGFYRSPYTNFNLSTDTLRLELQLEGPHGWVACEYDLYIYDELSGHFDISLHIREEV